MSVRLIGEVFQLPLRPTEKLVLLALADFANDDGSSIFPSLETLSKKSSASRSTVQRVLKSYRELGYIVQVQPATHRIPPVYRLCPEVWRAAVATETRGVSLTPLPLEGCQPDLETASRGVSLTPQGCHGDTQSVKGTVSRREPSYARRPLTPIPEPFELDDELRAFAARHGCQAPDRGFAAFRQWAYENDVRKRNWRATLGKWFVNHDRYGCPCQKRTHVRVEQRSAYEGQKRSKDTGPLNLSGFGRAMP